jgi:ElaB/YqjD/DUF883 family membrane-anchored ribosome-binding protein
MVQRRRLRDTTQLIKESLPVMLTDGEVLAHADRAARLQSEYNDRDEALKAHSKAAKAELETIESERNAALRKVRERREFRQVDVEVSYGFAENTVKYTRRDTGEVYHERAMTNDERQTQLFEVGIPDDTPQEERGRALADDAEA